MLLYERPWPNGVQKPECNSGWNVKSDSHWHKPIPHEGPVHWGKYRRNHKAVSHRYGNVLKNGWCFFDWLCLIFRPHLKRRRALVETNSSSNKMRHRRKKRAGQLDVRPYFFWYARWLKNSLVVRQVNIPFYEVDTMFQGQPTV
jgi:hypothetical protein